MWIFILCLLPLALAWDDQWCGYSRYVDAGRELPQDEYIVGGWEARIHEFPWMVSLNYNEENGGLHFCGGNIINSKWVVTGAHCIGGWEAERMKVIVAEHQRLGNDTENESKFEVAMARVVEHPGFDWDTYQNDIALVELAEELDFSVADFAYLPVCKPEPWSNGTTLEGEMLTASGWGSVKNDETVKPNTLRYTNLRVTTNDICNNCTLMVHTVFEDMICTGYCGQENNRDTCWGDSGGGLVRRDDMGRFEIIGMSSWGYRCTGRTPGVHVRVPYFLDWIDSIIYGDE